MAKTNKAGSKAKAESRAKAPEPAINISAARSLSDQGFVQISDRFARLNRLILRDLNGRNSEVSFFSKFTKDNISDYLSNPQKNESKLREAVVYLYDASPHFKRLIKYFAGLSDLSYIVSPFNIDPNTANITTVNRNYRKTLHTMSLFNPRTQFDKILTVVLREDVYYGTIWATKDNVSIQQLPSKYCAISSVEGNVCNVTFDFSYFSRKENLLEFYPPEFREKYEAYKRSKSDAKKWVELNSPNSFAIKCNTDILNYAVPPFAGILREVYDLEDYKRLKLTKTALENYAMLDMRLPMDEEGNWQLDFDKAKEFWQNLDAVLPDAIGSILSPMPINKISFDKSGGTTDNKTIANAEQNLFTAAGVSSLLFNNEKASANALLLSIKADQAITFGIVKSIEDMVNRYIQAQTYGRYFKVTFLDVSAYNRKEMGDQYLKAAQYGLPTVMLYAVSQGLSQTEFDSMNFLENEVLGLKEKLIPLQNSHTQSSSDSEGGRPAKDDGDLSDSGEQTREDGDDW